LEKASALITHETKILYKCLLLFALSKCFNKDKLGKHTEIDPTWLGLSVAAVDVLGGFERLKLRNYTPVLVVPQLLSTRLDMSPPRF